MAKQPGLLPSEASRRCAEHGIIQRYPAVFANKTSTWKRAGRVAVIDGYAGPGQYDDSTRGSPLLITDAANSSTSSAGARWSRRLDNCRPQSQTTSLRACQLLPAFAG
jgi:hypothetical protein